MKKIIWCLILLISLNLAFSTISLEDTSITKDESINLIGSGLIPNSNSNIIISYSNIIIHEDVVNVDSNGSFSYSYDVSYLDPSGEWNVLVFNESFLVNVNPSTNSSTLLISFINPISNNIYSRASDLSIKANITNNFIPVNDAVVKAYFNNQIFDLELVDGFYVNNISLPYNMSTGNNELIISCLSGSIGGENSIIFDVRKAELDLDVKNLDFTSLRMGEVIEFDLSVLYENNDFLINPELSVSVNDVIVNLSSVNNKDFFGEYVTSNSDNDILIINIIVSDEAGNTVSYSHSINLTNRFIYLIYKNWYFILAGVIIFGVIVYFSVSKTSKIINSDNLKKKKKELLIAQKEAQNDYYKEGSIDKDTYEKLMNDYEEQIQEIKIKLKKKK